MVIGFYGNVPVTSNITLDFERADGSRIERFNFNNQVSSKDSVNNNFQWFLGSSEDSAGIAAFREIKVQTVRYRGWGYCRPDSSRN